MIEKSDRTIPPSSHVIQHVGNGQLGHVTAGFTWPPRGYQVFWVVRLAWLKFHILVIISVVCAWFYWICLCSCYEILLSEMADTLIVLACDLWRVPHWETEFRQTSLIYWNSQTSGRSGLVTLTQLKGQWSPATVLEVLNSTIVLTEFADIRCSFQSRLTLL